LALTVLNGIYHTKKKKRNFLFPDGVVAASTLSSCGALQAVTSDLRPVPVRDLNSLV